MARKKHSIRELRFGGYRMLLINSDGDTIGTLSHSDIGAPTAVITSETADEIAEHITARPNRKDGCIWTLDNGLEYHASSCGYKFDESTLESKYHGRYKFCPMCSERIRRGEVEKEENTK